MLNAFTDEEKLKLEGVEPGAEVNAKSDWNQSNTEADDFIKNKPPVSAIGFAGAYYVNQIEKYCTNANQFYKMDWNFTVEKSVNFTFDGANHRWVYTGTETGDITIVTTFTGSHDDGSVREITWELRKNGVSVPAAPKVVDIESSDSMSVTMAVPSVEMSENDYIELWVKINSPYDKAYVSNINFLIR